MVHHLKQLLFSLPFLLVASPTQAQTPGSRTHEKSVQQSIEKAERAVVGIFVSRADSPPSLQEMSSPVFVPEYFGSGVMVDDRLVLTCYHVVQSASVIGVRLPSTKSEPTTQLHRATIYAADTRTDLAVLRLENPRVQTATLEIGKGEDLRKGSFVLAMGQSLPNDSNSAMALVSSGIVSNLRMRRPVEPLNAENARRSHFGMIVQADTRARPGTSGGALVDTSGKLVGVLTSQASLGGESAGDHAILLDPGMRRVVDVLRRGEEVEYGFLGVSRMSNSYRRAATGVELNHIIPKSPAAQTGLSDGDVALRVDGQSVSSFDEMVMHIGLSLAGREIDLEVQRSDSTEPQIFKIKLAKAYHPDFGIATNLPAAVHGLHVDYASVLSNMAAPFGMRAMPRGVVVRSTDKGSPAEAAGLLIYADVIKAVNGVTINNPADFYREAKKAMSANQPLALDLANRRETVTLKREQE